MHIIGNSVLSLLFVSGLIAYYAVPGGMNEVLLLSLSIIAFIAYLVSVFWLKSISNLFSWFSFFNMFNISMLIVNFQFPALCYFVAEIAESPFIWHQYTSVNKCAALSLVGYVLFLLGYMNNIFKLRSVSAIKKVGYISPLSIRRFLHVGSAITWLLFVLFIIIVGPAYLSGAYDGTKNWGSGATYIYLLFQSSLFVVIGLDHYALKLEHKNLGLYRYLSGLNKPIMILAALFVLLNVYTGERGSVVQVGVLYAGAYTFFLRKLSFVWFAAAICLGAVLMTFMSLYRTRDASVSLEERIITGKERTQELKWYNYTGDLAGSVRINNAAMQYFGDSPFLGRTMLVEAGSAVPFLTGAMAKTSPWTGLGANGSYYYTQLLSPITNKGNQTGAGNTLFGDIYMNFKMPGILIMFPLLGLFCAYVEYQAKYNVCVFYNVIYMVLLTWAVYWPRSAYFGPTRNIVWVLLVTYIAFRVMKGRGVMNKPVMYS